MVLFHGKIFARLQTSVADDTMMRYERPPSSASTRPAGRIPVGPPQCAAADRRRPEHRLRHTRLSRPRRRAARPPARAGAGVPSLGSGAAALLGAQHGRLADAGAGRAERRPPGHRRAGAEWITSLAVVMMR